MVLDGLIANVPVGGYISVWKVIPFLIVVLVWGRLLTWIDKDAPAVYLPRIPINLGMIAGFVLGVALFFVLPGFAIALAVLVFLALVDVGVYLFIRNQKVGLGDLQKQFSDWIHGFGRGEKAVEAPPGDVLLYSAGNPVAAPVAEDPTRGAYDAVQTVLTEPLRRFAERIDLGPSEAGWGVRYVVDGVTYSGAAMDKNAATAGVQYVKQLAGMDMNERRKPQSGSMRVTVDGKRHELDIQTAGSAAGEQMRLDVDSKKRHHAKLDELGFTPEQLEMLKESIRDNTGVVIVAAPKGQGMTSALYGILRAHDAFLSHIQTLEPDPDLDLEGITQNKLSAVPNPAEDRKQIEWAISQEPDVIMVSRLEDQHAAQSLAKFAAERRVYVGVRAGNAFDAMGAWRKVVGDDRLAMRNLKLVICGRVMRRLCTACKVGYSPEPSTLRKLNMDPDKIDRLYQARTTPLRDPKGNPIPCEFCRELQYRGRIGVYETLVLDDDMRAIVEAGASANQLKAAFRKQRGKYLQEQALGVVESGETSVQEVLRVMKIGESPAASGGGARPAAGGGGAPRQPRTQPS